MDPTPSAAATGMKPAAGVPIAPQSSKITAPPVTGIGKLSLNILYPRMATGEGWHR